MVRQAREREQQIGQPVEVDHEPAGHRRLMRQVDHAPLGPAADGAREMERRRLGRARGQHDGLERRQLLVGLIHDPLELGHAIGRQVGLLQRLGDLVGVRRRELAADGEQVALHRLEQRVEVGRRGGAGDPDGRAQLVHVAVRRHPRVVVGDAAAPERGGLALVAGPGVDLHRHGPSTSAPATTTFSRGSITPHRTLPSRVSTCSIHSPSRGNAKSLIGWSRRQ
jgi:hypothetical protein